MKKQTILMCALGVAAIAATALGTGYSVSSKKGGVFFAGGDDGVWKHYARKEATKTEKGIREYWVNCLTNEHVFTAPTTGTIEEGGAYKTEGFAEDDDRWIYPATLTAQDVVMTATTKALDLGTYKGGTVSYIKAGTFNLGTDPANLDVSGFKADHTDDGMKTVEIGTIKDGKEYALTCETTFVSALIGTKEDYLKYVVPEENVNKFGFYKLTTNLNLRGAVTYCSTDSKKDYFAGTLDGCNYKITASSDQTNGIFGNLRFATIQNLNIEDIWYNAGAYVSLLGRFAFDTKFINVTTKLTGARDGLRATGTETPETTNSHSYLAWNTFQSNTLIDCTFDASGFKIGSLFGCATNMTPPFLAKNCIVKAAYLGNLMDSYYKKKVYQPENVTLKDGEEAIKGITFVQADK